MQMPRSKDPELDPAFDLLKTDPSAAIEACNDYLSKNPDNERAYRIIYHACSRLGKWDGAFASANECVRVDSDRSFTYWMRAQASYRLEQYDDAMTDCRQALALDPDKVLGSMPYRLIALCYAMLGDVGNALDYAGRIKELRPNDWLPPIGPLPAGTKAQFTETVRRMATRGD